MTAQAPDSIVREGRRVLEEEGRAVLEAAESLGSSFAEAVCLLAATPGRVVVAGIGKSGIVARKIAATLTSTGTPATFLHPVEALHGDLGLVSRDDAALLLSKSGETEELLGLLSYFVRLGVPVVSLTGNRESSLGRLSSVCLDVGVTAEACPLDLAPTTSTTLALAMGDALAVALLKEKGFKPEDFARLHPGGSLGRRLTVQVADVMVREDYPSLSLGARMRECIVPLARMRGTVPIVDQAEVVVGVVTAGDLTRLMESRDDFLEVPVEEVMTRSPQLARESELGAAALHTMETHGIMALPVVDQGGRLRGLVHLHDLLKSGVA
ncbi:MAG: KpsF/GutQ family sugar-phosphate isomerase [Gemmatimonadota bacterium]